MRRSETTLINKPMQRITALIVILMLVLITACDNSTYSLIKAKAGDADAQNSLGVMYADGEGVAQDESKAVEWYRKAAEQGHTDAQFNLGKVYFHGDGVAQDRAKAVEWYAKAAEQGHAEAQYTLGWIYEEGRVVVKNNAKSVAWLTRAAKQGYAEAQYRLSWMYGIGFNVTKDSAKSVVWLTRAAEQGHAFAQFLCGEMYFEGAGVPRDLVRAYAWLNLAAAQGDSDSRKLRPIVEMELTPEQRAAGQRLASDWKPGGAIKVEQEGEKNKKNRQEKGRERQLIEEKEKQKKEIENNFGGAKKDRTIELRVGEPIFLDNHLHGEFYIGLRIKQSITVFSSHEDVRRATVKCTATALVQKKGFGDVMEGEKYIEIEGFQDVVFGMGKTRSTSEIDWKIERGIISIKDFKYNCDVTEGSR